MALESQIRIAAETGKARPVLDVSYAEQRVLALIGGAEPPLPEAKQRHVALVIAGYARDAEDLRDLLEMCGLVGYESQPVTGYVPRERHQESKSATTGEGL